MSAYADLHEEARDLADFDAPYCAPSLYGVPLHTARACHWRTCPECKGTGTVAINPRGDYIEVPCPNLDCDDGEIVEWVDPLIRLRNARRVLVRNRRSPSVNCRYGECKAAALSPESYLPADRAPVALRAAA